MILTKALIFELKWDSPPREESLHLLELKSGSPSWESLLAS